MEIIVLVVMVILKLTGFIDISWGWVIAAPVVMSIGLYISMLVLGGGMVAGLSIADWVKKINKRDEF
jgi:hypothetical protein